MNEKKPVSILGIIALILSIIGCTAIVGLILAIVDLKKDDGKNKLLSKIALGICGLWLIIMIFASIGRRNRVETTETSETAIVAVSETTVEETSVEATESSEESLVIDLVAGELGEYGDVVVLGANTEFPDTNYCYVVPAGTYNVTNVGDYMTQVDIVRNELATDVDSDGNEYEYWAEATPYMIDVGATEVITIDAGWFIEIEEPTHLTLESVGSTTPQNLILPVTTDAISNTGTVSIDDYLILLDSALSGAFGENYTIEYEDGFINVSVWQDGVAQGAALAASGDQSSLESWNYMVSGIQVMAENITSDLSNVEADGVDQVHVFINVLNDQTPENTLLTFLDDTVVFSAVQ